MSTLEEHRSPEKMAKLLASKLTVAEFGELADLMDDSDVQMYEAITDIDIEINPGKYSNWRDGEGSIAGSR